MKHLKTFYKKWFQLLVVIVISFISGALGSFSINQLTQKSTVSTSNNNSTITQTAYKNENSTTQAVNKVKDAVVSVITYSANRQNERIWRMMIVTQILSKSLVKDLGLFIKKNDKEAYIVTNNHVINGASKVDIRCQMELKYLEKSSELILSLILLSSKSLQKKVTTVAEFGDSSKLTVGETAIAIGSR